MALKKLVLKPGVNRENTRYANEGGWYESDKVRFRQGTPEKIGGWQVDSGVYSSSVPTSTFSSGGTSTAATPTSASFWGLLKDCGTGLT